MGLAYSLFIVQTKGIWRQSGAARGLRVAILFPRPLCPEHRQRRAGYSASKLVLLRSRGPMVSRLRCPKECNQYLAAGELDVAGFWPRGFEMTRGSELLERRRPNHSLERTRPRRAVMMSVDQPGRSARSR